MGIEVLAPVFDRGIFELAGESGSVAMTTDQEIAEILAEIGRNLKRLVALEVAQAVFQQTGKMPEVKKKERRKEERRQEERRKSGPTASSAPSATSKI
jgi:hypothetical protein